MSVRPFQHIYHVKHKLSLRETGISACPSLKQVGTPLMTASKHEPSAAGDDPHLRFARPPRAILPMQQQQQRRQCNENITYTRTTRDAGATAVCGKTDSGSLSLMKSSYRRSQNPPVEVVIVIFTPGRKGNRRIGVAVEICQLPAHALDAHCLSGQARRAKAAAAAAAEDSRY